jgi:hypothetical protein
MLVGIYQNVRKSLGRTLDNLSNFRLRVVGPEQRRKCPEWIQENKLWYGLNKPECGEKSPKKGYRRVLRGRLT